jgi:flagellar protein FlaF
MQNAAQVYGKVAKDTAQPRELEATLLLRAAARLQAIQDSWEGKASELDDALIYNRKLWSIFLTSVTRDDNPLPAEVRQNIANLGVFVLKHTLSLTPSSARKPERLRPLISINRELAAGLLARA